MLLLACQSLTRRQKCWIAAIAANGQGDSLIGSRFDRLCDVFGCHARARALGGAEADER